VSLPHQNLTQQSGPITHLASDLGWSRQKYNCTVQCIIGLCHSPPQMKNQHGLNEGKILIRENMIPQLSASDVTCVVSLNTNNQANKYEDSGELVRDGF
jgi:hypothetical protein